MSCERSPTPAVLGIWASVSLLQVQHSVHCNAFKGRFKKKKSLSKFKINTMFGDWWNYKQKITMCVQNNSLELFWNSVTFRYLACLQRLLVHFMYANSVQCVCVCCVIVHSLTGGGSVLLYLLHILFQSEKNLF